MAFTSLNHYLDAQWLEYAFECIRGRFITPKPGRRKAV